MLSPRRVRALPQALLLLLLALLLLAAAAAHAVPPSGDPHMQRGVPDPTISFAPPFFGTSRDPVPHWTFGGSAVVAETVVRLTPDRQDRAGFLWLERPVLSVAWEVELEFRVHGKGRHSFGDGMALWFAQQPGPEGKLFGNSPHFRGIGVVFDTFDNDHDRQNPAVYVLRGTDTPLPEAAWELDFAPVRVENKFCKADFRNTRDPVVAKILLMNGNLDVLLRIDDKWMSCLQLSGLYFAPQQTAPVEPDAEPVVGLPFFFGLTAQTGQVADNHDVVRFHYRDLSSRAAMDSVTRAGGATQYMSRVSAHVPARATEHVTQPISFGYVALRVVAFLVVVAAVTAVYIAVRRPRHIKGL